MAWLTDTVCLCQRCSASRDKSPTISKGSAAYGGSDLQKVTALRSEKRSGAERRTYAWGPDRPQQDSDPELTRITTVAIGPIRNRTAWQSEAGLEGRKYQHRTEDNHQRGGDLAKQFGSQPDRIPDRRNE